MPREDFDPLHEGLTPQMSRGPCTVTATSAFAVHEQKMVDTLLVCDLLALVDRSSSAAALVVSGDSDFVPALLFARRKTAMPLFWVIPAETAAADEFLEVVRLCGVGTGFMQEDAEWS